MRGAPIIGIAGPARSGKDTIADFILAERGGYRYAFADPIRAMLKPLGIDMYDQYWMARKEEVIPALGASPRKLMQTLGTEWGRQMINEDIWLILAKQQLLRNGGGMLISDVRFENEAQWIRANGGEIIHVIRKAAPTVNAHASEGGVKAHENDVLIVNDGSLEELQAVILDLLDGVKA